MQLCNNPTPLHEQDATVNFQVEFNWFEFKVFFSPKLVVIPRLKSLVWRENSWMPTFPKVISTM